MFRPLQPMRGGACVYGRKVLYGVAPMLILEIAAGVALAPVIAFLVLAVIGLLIRFWMPIAVVAACVAIWLAGIVTYYQAPA